MVLGTGMDRLQAPLSQESPTQEGNWPDWDAPTWNSPWAHRAMPERNSFLPSSQVKDDLALFSTSLPILFESKMKLLAEEDTENANGSHGNWERNGTNRFSLLSRKTSALDLPDEEELLDGIAGNYELGGGEYDYLGEFEETDVFNSGGGMEMEFQDSAVGSYANGYNVLDGLHRPVNGDYPHPSRTLFVRNISSTVEDSELRSLFEQYGDIRTLFTKAKHRGFVMVSYYDIRHARAAMRVLQRYPFKRRKLNIHFSLPKENPSEKDVNQGTLVIFNLDASVSHDELKKIFGVYGEVKEIRETPHKRHHKFIEFYDVRAADAALRALNRTEIAGKRIKLEPSRPGGARRSMIQQRQEQEWSSPPGQWNYYYPNENGGGIPVPNGGGLRSNHALFQPHYTSLPNNVSPLDPYGGSPLSGASSAVFRSEGSEGGHFQRASPEAELSGASLNGRASPSYGSPFAWGSSHSSGMWGTTFHAHTGSPFTAGHHFMSPLGNGLNELAVGMNRIEQGPSSPRFEMLSPRPRSRMIPPCMDGFNGLARGRRPENSISQTDKDFQLDLERIINGEDTRTTLMIKNIPNKYSAKMLLQAIDQQNRGTYDFLYLPIDFKNKCNVGYAFINMISPEFILMFYEAFEGRKWERFNSEKVASLAYARIQGKEALIAHFQNSSLMHEDKRCRPMMFCSDGPKAGEQEPFPIRTWSVNTSNSTCDSKDESGLIEERLFIKDTGAG